MFVCVCVLSSRKNQRLRLRIDRRRYMSSIVPQSSLYTSLLFYCNKLQQNTVWAALSTLNLSFPGAWEMCCSLSMQKAFLRGFPECLELNSREVCRPFSLPFCVLSRISLFALMNVLGNLALHMKNRGSVHQKISGNLFWSWRPSGVPDEGIPIRLWFPYSRKGGLGGMMVWLPFSGIRATTLIKFLKFSPLLHLDGRLKMEWRKLDRPIVGENNDISFTINYYWSWFS